MDALRAGEGLGVGGRVHGMPGCFGLVKSPGEGSDAPGTGRRPRPGAKVSIRKVLEIGFKNVPKYDRRDHHGLFKNCPREG